MKIEITSICCWATLLWRNTHLEQQPITNPTFLWCSISSTFSISDYYHPLNSHFEHRMRRGPRTWIMEFTHQGILSEQSPWWWLELRYYNYHYHYHLIKRWFKKKVTIMMGWWEAGLHESLQPCSRAARKWRKNEEMRGYGERMRKLKRKWRENEKMERDSLSTFPHSLFISSLSIHFLYQNLSHFVAKS